MSEYVRVFCRSDAIITRREIAEFICDGVYFDHPRFEPRLGLRLLDEAAWDSFDVYYAEGKRPVQIYRNAGDALFNEELAETLEELAAHGALPDLIDGVAASQQTIAIEFGILSTSEDAHAMMTALTAHLAERLLGLIYISGDGIFDSHWQQLFAS